MSSKQLIVITGSSSGIGKALAQNFAKDNNNVLAIARSENALLELKDEYPENINYICGDVSSKEIQASIKNYIEENNFKVKYLVHCAGIIDPIKEIDKISHEEWQTIQDINVTAPLFLTTALKGTFVSKARVLFISSQWGHYPEKNFTAYCVSKAALIMLNKCLELELPNLSFGILDPGGVDTPILGKVKKQNEHKATNQSGIKPPKKSLNILLGFWIVQTKKISLQRNGAFHLVAQMNIDL